MMMAVVFDAFNAFVQRTTCRVWNASASCWGGFSSAVVAPRSKRRRSLPGRGTGPARCTCLLVGTLACTRLKDNLVQF